MQSKDLALVRRDRGLEKRVEKDGVDCMVRKWSGAWEVSQM